MEFIRFISHRANNSSMNIREDYDSCQHATERLIDKGFDVEIDLWKVGKQLYLGHDKPNRQVDSKWLIDRVDNLLIHAKNRDALSWLAEHNSEPRIFAYHFFWHETDKYTLTSMGIPIIYPGQEPIDNGILMMPEDASWNLESVKKYKLHGICSDYIGHIKDKWLNE